MDWAEWITRKLCQLQRDYGTHLTPHMYVPYAVFQEILESRETDRRFYYQPMLVSPVGEVSLLYYFRNWSCPITPLPHLDFVRIDLGPA